MLEREALIPELDKLAEWKETHDAFSKYSRQLRNEMNLKWGCALYEINFTEFTKVEGFKNPAVSFKIWQFYIDYFSSSKITTTDYL